MGAPFSVTFLGTGTSTGVPMIGCDCPVCRSADPRDARLRPSILVRGPQGAILVDTTPEMRLQLLRAHVETIDAALITHTHADHIYGMDDLRQISFRTGAAVPVYGTIETLDRLRIVFDYCFRQTLQEGGGRPKLELIPIEPYVPFTLCGLTITPLIVLHGRMEVITFKFEDAFAYGTDVSAIPEATRPYLRGLDALVLGAVRVEPPSHSTHFILPEALDEIAALAPRRAYLTHLSHHFDHVKISAILPDEVELAYDGLTLTFEGG